jgi:hypothetical protein
MSRPQGSFSWPVTKFRFGLSTLQVFSIHTQAVPICLGCMRTYEDMALVISAVLMNSLCGGQHLRCPGVGG